MGFRRGTDEQSSFVRYLLPGALPHSRSLHLLETWGGISFLLASPGKLLLLKVVEGEDEVRGGGRLTSGGRPSLVETLRWLHG